MMWLRTAVNYQYRYGVGIAEAMISLYNDGGIPRFYKGLAFALLQGPLSRFGAVAANEGSTELIKLLKLNNEFYNLNLSTALGSILSSLWRVLLMPIDTCKTVLQVDGNQGFELLISRVLNGDVLSLYRGTYATILTTLVGHYPWFITHNYLEKNISKSKKIRYILLRNAFIGFVSSAVSDTISNILRVIKTVKQSSTAISSESSYYDILLALYHEDGIINGLFGRGLLLRIISNGIQSILFVVVWKLVADILRKRSENAHDGDAEQKHNI